MRRNPRYKRTLEKAEQFALASKLAKEVYYHHLPKAVRKHGLYGKLTGLANTALQEGKRKEEVRTLLITHCQSLAAAAKPAAIPSTPKAVKPTNTEQPSTVNNQLSSVNFHLSTNNAQPTPLNAQVSSINYPLSSNNAQRSTINEKHPRYLSRWKVKKNGRLLTSRPVPHPDPDRPTTMPNINPIH